MSSHKHLERTFFSYYHHALIQPKSTAYKQKLVKSMFMRQDEGIGKACRMMSVILLFFDRVSSQSRPPENTFKQPVLIA